MSQSRTGWWSCVTWPKKVSLMCCAALILGAVLAVTSFSFGQDCVDGCWRGKKWYNVYWKYDYHTTATVCVTFAREGGSIGGTCGGKKSLTRYKLSGAWRYCAAPNKWRGENQNHLGTIVATQSPYLDEYACSGES